MTSLANHDEYEEPREVAAEIKIMIDWFGLHKVLLALLDVVRMGVTGLLIYLIGYTMD